LKRVYQFIDDIRCEGLRPGKEFPVFFAQEVKMRKYYIILGLLLLLIMIFLGSLYSSANVSVTQDVIRGDVDDDGSVIQDGICGDVDGDGKVIQDGICGDVDGDGKVGIGDILSIELIMLGQEPPQYGGILRLINYGATVQGSLGVTENMRGGDGFACRPCIETIFNQSQVTAEVIPMLGTSYEWSTDLKTFTLHLRQGIKFQDGTPCNAHTIKWNYDRAKAASVAGSELYLSTEVANDYTLYLHTDGYHPQIIAYMTGSVLGSPLGLMMSEMAITTLGEDYNNLHPVGTGPFKFKGYKQDDFIEWERFDDYWGGKPCLDGIKFINIADATTATLAFEAGEGDAIGVFNNTDQMHDLLPSGKYTYSTMPSLRTALIPSSGHADTVWANPLVREAAEYAIDKKAITDSVYYSYFYPSYFFATPALRPDPSRDDSFPGLTPRIYNPVKARELLAQAGYSHGFQTKLWGTTGMLPSGAATAIMANLADVGITCELQQISAAKWIELETNGWDEGLLCSPTGNDANLATYFTRFWWTPTAPNWSTGIYWDALYRPPELQTLLEKFMTEPDPAKAKQLGMDFVKLAYDQALAIPMWDWILVGVQYPYVHGLDLYLTTSEGMWPTVRMDK
jgi:ABC-type transport system substrate-binding protein